MIQWINTQLTLLKTQCWPGCIASCDIGKQQKPRYHVTQTMTNTCNGVMVNTGSLMPIYQRHIYECEENKFAGLPFVLGQAVTIMQ